MFTADAIAHFGPDPIEARNRIAEALGVSYQAVAQWPDLVPPLSAARLSKYTDGALEFDPDIYVSWNNRKAVS